jgi:hypothetical protein
MNEAHTACTHFYYSIMSLITLHLTDPCSRHDRMTNNNVTNPSTNHKLRTSHFNPNPLLTFFSPKEKDTLAAGTVTQARRCNAGHSATSYTATTLACLIGTQLGQWLACLPACLPARAPPQHPWERRRGSVVHRDRSALCAQGAYISGTVDKDCRATSPPSTKPQSDPSMMDDGQWVGHHPSL